MASGDLGSSAPRPNAFGFWNALTPPNKLLLIGVVAVIVVGVVLLLTGGMMPTPAKVPLLAGHTFHSDDLARAVKAFQTANLTDFEPAGNLILIPKGRETAYLTALSAADALPGDFYQAFDKYITEQRSWWASSQADERNFRVAKAKLLARVIEGYQGVERAIVDVSETEPRGIRRVAKTTAYVQVFTTNSGTINPVVEEKLRTLVASAFKNLAPQDVAIAVDSSGKPAPSDDWIDTGFIKAKNLYLQTKAAYEEGIEKKLTKLFSSMEGVDVVANVQLSPEKRIKQDSVHYEKGVAASTDTTERSSGTTGAGARGEPGARPNQDVPAPASNQPISAQSSSTESEETTRTEYKNPTMTVSMEKEDFVLEKVGVVIKVPRTYLEATTDASGAAQPAQTSEAEIRSSVLALGLPGLTETNIQVLKYTPAPPPVVEPARIDWLDLAGKVGGPTALALLAAGALAVAWMIARKAPVPALAPLPTVEAAPQVGEERVLPELPLDEAARKFKKLEEAIVDLVKKNPGSAGSLLRRWIQTEE
jgi:flagellar biosynthesis/type III secretory pathway M-ring protein FliF/YscJ